MKPTVRDEEIDFSELRRQLESELFQRVCPEQIAAYLRVLHAADRIGFQGARSRRKRAAAIREMFRDHYRRWDSERPE